MCIHHFYSGKCTKGDQCINSHEFQKKDLIHENEKKIIQVQAKQILELENQIQEQNRITQSLQLQTVSEKPVVCETSTTVINEYLTGGTDKETKSILLFYLQSLRVLVKVPHLLNCRWLRMPVSRMKVVGLVTIQKHRITT